MLEIYDRSILAWSLSSSALTMAKRDRGVVNLNRTIQRSRRLRSRQTRTGYSRGISAVTHHDRSYRPYHDWHPPEVTQIVVVWQRVEDIIIRKW